MRVSPVITLVVSVLIAGAITVGPAGAQSDAELKALDQQLRQLHQAGKYAEATRLAEQYVARARERYGEQHPEYARAISWLALLLNATNRLSEAEPLYRRALAIDEKTFGPEHANVATHLNNLALLLRATNRLSEAEPLMRRALVIDEKSLGPEHPKVVNRLSNLALVLKETNRLSEAEPLYRRALAIDEKTFWPDHPKVANRLSNLALVLYDTNRLSEAEPLTRRALAIDEKTFGPEHANVATHLNNLALLLRATNRLSEAEPLMRRALVIDEKSLGPEHPKVVNRLSNLALVLKETNRLSEAEPLYRRALAIDEKTFGPDHPKVAIPLNNLALLLKDSNRQSEAEDLMRRALVIDEKSLGPEHPRVAIRLSNLGMLQALNKRLDEAEPLMRRALAIDEKTFGPEHPKFAIRLSNLAVLSAERGDWMEAAALGRRAKPSLTARKGGNADDGDGLGKSAVATDAWSLRMHARAQYRAGADDAVLREEGFELAQWALQTGAADALSQMSVRFGTRAGPLAQLVRERQDLIGHRQDELRRLDVAAGRADAKAAEAARLTITQMDQRLNAIDARLATEFPDLTQLANPKPLSIAATQALLGPTEALVLFLDVPDFGTLPRESLIWVVTKNDARWRSIPRGTGALSDRVAALRCGLDQAAWDGDGAHRCNGLLGGAFTRDDARAGRALPFDLVQAYELYQALFGHVQDLISDKHLLIVPSGALSALPFHVLVTQSPAAVAAFDAASYGNAAWLAKRHAVTVLPSVASLKALRQFAKTSRATRPFIGFGNPLLLGPDGNDRRAWDRQNCDGPVAPVQVASRGVRSAMPKFFRSGYADVEQVRAQYPLPETTDELCAVAQAIGATQSEVYLGDKASELTVKALSANGELATARVVHFATHGLLAGETEMLASSKAEPALILTPPKIASEQDDGLLTASEIAQLKLDADWVVLSACNTAAGETDKPSAEALSGLARAFFYAGARALLVSHWAVNSDATVKLITTAFDELKADPKIGRAEALRRSMLGSIANGGGYAHPANWAPFVLVGEGAR